MMVSKCHCDFFKKIVKSSYESITTICIAINGNRGNIYRFHKERDFCNIDCLTKYIKSIRPKKDKESGVKKENEKL